MPAATRDPGGLAAQLRRVQTQLSDLLGVPCIIGEQTDDHTEYVLIHTVRTVVPPYRADQHVSRIDAHVLVEAFGADHAANADVIATAMLHLLADASWELVAGQPDLDVWTALGRRPGPAFMINIAVTLSIVRRQAPLVRGPLDVQSGGIRHVAGRVLAADGTPLAGARIRWRPNGVPTVTGHDGRWKLSLPTLAVQLDVSARGVYARYTLARLGESTADGSGSNALAQSDIDIVLAEVGADSAPEPLPSTPNHHAPGTR